LDGEDLAETFTTDLYIVGSQLTTDFDVIINKVTSSYIKNGEEIFLNIDPNLFKINGKQLSINRSDIEYKYGVRIPLYYKIGVTIQPYSNDNKMTPYNEIIGIVVDYDYDIESYKDLLGNGFYVHGRAGIFDEIDYYDENPTNQIKPTN